MFETLRTWFLPKFIAFSILLILALTNIVSELNIFAILFLFIKRFWKFIFTIVNQPKMLYNWYECSSYYYFFVIQSKYGY